MENLTIVEQAKLMGSRNMYEVFNDLIAMGDREPTVVSGDRILDQHNNVLFDFLEFCGGKNEWEIICKKLI